MKNTLPYFFCILALLLMAACATVAPDVVQPDAQPQNPAPVMPNPENDVDAPSVEPSVSEPAEQQVMDYGGREFTIAMYDNSLFLPQADSSPISNRILQRNAEVEKAYNIKIKALEQSDGADFVTQLNSLYNSGLFCGDLLVIPNYLLPLFVSQDRLMSVKALPFVDLSADCFDKTATDAATIGNFVHAVYGDLTYLPDKSVCVFFNKDFVESHNLLSPYEMERNRDWSWDSFNVLAKAVIQDVNQNGVIDFYDVFGLCSRYTQSEMVNVVWASCGQHFFENNPPYAPKMIFNNKNTENIIDKIRRLLYNELDKIYISDTIGISGLDLFMAGRALFCIDTLDKAAQISAAGINFGVMPLPRLDKNSEYNAYIDSSAQAVCVLNNIPDSDFSGRILQALAEASSFNNTDYYKKYYIANFLTDNSSALMLDKIFGRPYFDLATSLGPSYPEIAAASNEIIYSHLSTGISFDTLYEQNIQPFENFATNSFTHKGD